IANQRYDGGAKDHHQVTSGHSRATPLQLFYTTNTGLCTLTPELSPMPWITERGAEITWDRLHQLMEQTVAEARRRICAKPKRVLLLPPDITRMHSGAGKLTEILYNLLAGEAEIHVIPTL